MAVPVKVRLVPMCVASHRRFHYLDWLRSRLTIHHYLLTTNHSQLPSQKFLRKSIPEYKPATCSPYPLNT